MEDQGLNDSASQRDPIAPTTPTPRLSIYHLLVATVCVAVYLGVARLSDMAGGFVHRVPDPSPSLRTTMMATTVLNRVGVGLTLAGIVLFVARRRRRLPFLVHPGESLIVLLGLSTLVETRPVVESMLTWGHPVLQVIVILVTLAFAAITVAFYFWAVSHAAPRRWQVFWLSMLLPCCLGFVTWLGPLSFTASHLVLVAVLFYDYRDRVQRPWTHWFGVILYLYFGLVFLIETVAVMTLRA